MSTPRTSPGSDDLQAPRRSRTIRSTRSAASIGFSCSHTLMTFQPSRSSRSLVSRSRSRFVSIFSRQNAALFAGHVACSGQPCQKHPSTKTATRDGPKTMSGRRRRSASTGRSTRNRRPRACNSRRSASSGFVSRLPVRDRRSLTADEDVTTCCRSGPRNVRPMRGGPAESSRRDARGTRRSDPQGYGGCRARFAT